MTEANSAHLLNDSELAELKPVVHDLLSSEYDWFMKKLPLKYKVQVSEMYQWNPKGEDPFPASFILGGVEVALMLTGLKPCVVYSHGSCADLGRLWMEGVITPWINKHQEQLDKLGLVATLTPKHTVAQFAAKHNCHFGMNAAFLYRESHPLTSFCKEVFSKPKATGVELQKAFGYPSPASEDFTVHYQIAPAAVPELMNIPPSNELPDFIGFEYECPAKHAQSLVAAGRHFAKCRHALGLMGVPICLDANEELSPQSLSFLFLSAARGSISQTVHMMVEEDALWRRPQHDMERTLTFMTNLEPKWEEMTKGF